MVEIRWVIEIEKERDIDNERFVFKFKLDGKTSFICALLTSSTNSFGILIGATIQS